MNKIVINNCYGGFSLSMKALQLLYKKRGEEYIYPYKEKWDPIEYRKCSLEESDWLFKEDKGESFSDPNLLNEGICCYDIDCPRHDKNLVEVVEELGDKASGDCAKLKVVQIPGNIYRIDEYDGAESIETPDTLDWITI